MSRAGGSSGGIDVKDALQAGICLRFGLPFATRNLRHFDRVPGLQLEHP
jgi:tRNA(fMet)-specific endonuclease VapC